MEVDEEEPIKKKPAMMKKRLKKNMVEEAVIKIKVRPKSLLLISFKL